MGKCIQIFLAGKHLTYEHRLILQRDWNGRVERLDAGLTLSSFAREHGLHPETWRREYLKGAEQHARWNQFKKRYDYGRYDADRAQAKTDELAAERGPRQKITGAIADEFSALVLDREGMHSPYDAWKILGERHPGQYIPSLSTFYNHIRCGDIAVKYGQTPYHPNHAPKKSKAHPARTVPGRATIQDRPHEAGDRSEPGHYEMDTVVSCAHGSGGVLVLIDRWSRKYFAVKLRRITQECVLKTLRRLIRSGVLGKVRTVTTDNGCEFLDAAALERVLRNPVYYTRAYAAYEKGSVENANRILRRWFPKGTDFAKVTPRQLRKAVENINAMHRESLGGLSSAQFCKQHAA